MQDILVASKQQPVITKTGCLNWSIIGKQSHVLLIIVHKQKWHGCSIMFLQKLISLNVYENKSKFICILSSIFTCDTLYSEWSPPGFVFTCDSLKQPQTSEILAWSESTLIGKMTTLGAIRMENFELKTWLKCIRLQVVIAVNTLVSECLPLEWHLL